MSERIKGGKANGLNSKNPFQFAVSRVMDTK